jgi:hypothetical protein
VKQNQAVVGLCFSMLAGLVTIGFDDGMVQT